jgi:hypothetical protein
MDASDLIKTLPNTLRGGGRPHMGLGLYEPHAWIHRLDCRQQHDRAQSIHRQNILHDGLAGASFLTAWEVARLSLRTPDAATMRIANSFRPIRGSGSRPRPLPSFLAPSRSGRASSH